MKTLSFRNEIDGVIINKITPEHMVLRNKLYHELNRNGLTYIEATLHITDIPNYFIINVYTF